MDERDVEESSSFSSTGQDQMLDFEEEAEDDQEVTQKES